MTFDNSFSPWVKRPCNTLSQPVSRSSWSRFSLRQPRQVRKRSGLENTQDSTRTAKYATKNPAMSSKTAKVSDRSMRQGWATISNLPLFSRDRKSVVYGKSVSVRVDIGGARISKKKKQKHKKN